MRGPGSAKHLAYHALREQFGLPGCAVCRLGEKAAARFLESLGGEALVDPDLRGTLRAALGFCSRHAHQLLATGAPLTVAILYEDFLKRAEGELDAWAQPRRRPPPPAACLACASMEQEEAHFLGVLAGAIDEPELAAAYERSDGLCLGHTLALCARLREPARRRIVARERERIAGLRGELAEVIRKHDYRFRDERWGEERTAPARAVAKLAGEGGSE